MLNPTLYHVAQMEHTERVRRSDLRRRALEARTEIDRQAATPTERRFSFFRLPVFRLRQA